MRSPTTNAATPTQAKGDLDHEIADYMPPSVSIHELKLTIISRPTTTVATRTQAKGDLDHAIADYNEASRLDAKFAIAYHGRGSAYNAKGDLDRALLDYNEAIRLDPKNAGAYFSRGFANL